VESTTEQNISITSEPPMAMCVQDLPTY